MIFPEVLLRKDNGLTHATWRSDGLGLYHCRMPVSTNFDTYWVPLVDGEIVTCLWCIAQRRFNGT